MGRSLILALLAFAAAGESFAGDLVVGGTVVKVTNTSNNASVFAIQVSGGTSNSCTGGWVTFSLAAAADADAHKRAYAAALLALTTGLPVRVHNYQGNDCGTAAYIEVG